MLAGTCACAGDAAGTLEGAAVLLEAGVLLTGLTGVAVAGAPAAAFAMLASAAGWSPPQPVTLSKTPKLTIARRIFSSK